MTDTTVSEPGFQEQFKATFEQSIQDTQKGLDLEQCLRIDLHCHDLNSDKPSIPLGRLLGARETWLPTEQLLTTLKQNGATALTITNHNHAKSCWELLDQGVDILVGAEFNCLLDDYDLGLHVLTYGFTPEDEPTLRRLGKQSVYKFLEYANSRDIVTVLAHPVYTYYKGSGKIHLEAWEKLALIFERFEVLNGQRDSWQNQLTIDWLRAMTPETLERLAKKHGVRPDEFCRRPYEKRFCGGSDDHMGILAGSTGTLLQVNDLERKLHQYKRSELALEALRNGRTAPYGYYSDPRKMGVAFIDYFCQLLIHLKDPGAVRLLLHKGSKQQKIQAMLTVNAIFELRRHKFTSKFLRAFHDALHGKKMGVKNTLFATGSSRALVAKINEIATYNSDDPASRHDKTDTALNEIYTMLVRHAGAKLGDALDKIADKDKSLDLPTLIDRLEVPLSFRDLMGNGAPDSDRAMSSVNVGELVDALSFPMLASMIIGAANFASTRAMFTNRPFLMAFAEKYGSMKPSERAMWLSDTFGDRNGVSHSLKDRLRLIQEFDLPIDLVVCSHDLEPEDHLIVLEPVATYAAPIYREQEIRVPDILALKRRFVDGGYTRVICSTEGAMGLAALYLKEAFHVPAWFFMHTDWVEFARRSMDFDAVSRDRLRRILRAFYGQFNGLFVLNSDHKRWLTSRKMSIPKEKVHVTAHWLNSDTFRPRPDTRAHLFPQVGSNEKILLYVGRISKEKGLDDLPFVLEKVKRMGSSVRLVTIGKGPYVDELKRQVPNAVCIDWVNNTALPAYYSSADLFVFPSTFDTFGRVLLEALSCGLPAVTYAVKGPKEIIQDGECGLRCRNRTEMAERIHELLEDEHKMVTLKQGSIRRAADFDKQVLMNDFLRVVGLSSWSLNFRAPKPRPQNDSGEHPPKKPAVKLVECV